MRRRRRHDRKLQQLRQYRRRLPQLSLGTLFPLLPQLCLLQLCLLQLCLL